MGLNISSPLILDIAAFKVFDADGSGTTSLSELKEILEKFGQKLTQQELDAVMAEIDSDGGAYMTLPCLTFYHSSCRLCKL